MPLVERQYPPGSTVPSGDDKHAEVCKPSIDVCIAALESENDAVVVGVERRDDEAFSSQVGDKRESRRATKAASENVINLGGDRRWNHEVAGFSRKQPLDAGAPRRKAHSIETVDRCDEAVACWACAEAMRLVMIVGMEQGPGG